jgi:hypothetical protein
LFLQKKKAAFYPSLFVDFVFGEQELPERIDLIHRAQFLKFGWRVDDFLPQFGWTFVFEAADEWRSCEWMYEFFIQSINNQFEPADVSGICSLVIWLGPAAGGG